MFLRRAYFKQDLQLHKTWQWANWNCKNCTFYTENSISQLHKLWSTARLNMPCFCVNSDLLAVNNDLPYQPLGRLVAKKTSMSLLYTCIGIFDLILKILFRWWWRFRGTPIIIIRKQS